MQISEVSVKVCFVGLPRQPVHTGGGVTLEREKCHPQQVDVDVVEERCEPLLLPLPCGLSYALQRLGHAFPILCPVRALLARIPLGPRPWLHRLRRVRTRFVRRLHSYYDGVRLLVSVHHRLRLLAFPMRTDVLSTLRPDTRSPSFRCDPFARDVALDPGRASAPRIAVPHMLPSSELSWLNPTPHAIAVYA